MSPIRMSKVEGALRVVLEFNEAFNQHDVVGMMQLMSADCVFENTLLWLLNCLRTKLL